MDRIRHYVGKQTPAAVAALLCRRISLLVLEASGAGPSAPGAGPAVLDASRGAQAWDVSAWGPGSDVFEGGQGALGGAGGGGSGGGNGKVACLEGKRMVSGHTGNVVPRKGLWVRAPCPPL